ncbi:MAG TPA: hypothetical protein VI547_05535, partial [Anaerolineales bacterium]|nr:hypothetical protein [Anaerolineales bacterium]
SHTLADTNRQAPQYSASEPHAYADPDIHRDSDLIADKDLHPVADRDPISDTNPDLVTDYHFINNADSLFDLHTNLQPNAIGDCVHHRITDYCRHSNSDSHSVSVIHNYPR